VPLTVQVVSDYVCPYCFLAEGPLNEARREWGEDATVEWLPFELRPHPTPTLRPEGDYLQKGWAASVYPLAEKMGVKIVLPRVSPQPYTRLAFEGSLYARDHGMAAEYNHRMFMAFFQDELDIGEADVLVRCAEEIGLDGAPFRASLDQGAYREECGALLRLTRDVWGVSSVPTFVIDSRIAIPGMLPKETLVQVLREQLAQGDEPADQTD
jgi:predicted DsbA family dithiol-disulfide isomerase